MTPTPIHVISLWFIPSPLLPNSQTPVSIRFISYVKPWWFRSEGWKGWRLIDFFQCRRLFHTIWILLKQQQQQNTGHAHHVARGVCYGLFCCAHAKWRHDSPTRSAMVSAMSLFWTRLILPDKLSFCFLCSTANASLSYLIQTNQILGATVPIRAIRISLTCTRRMCLGLARHLLICKGLPVWSSLWT